MRTYLDAGKIAGVLVTTIRDRNDIGGLENAAVVAGLVSRVFVAVLLVNGGKEVAKDVVIASAFDLEQGGLLGVDDGVDHVKVQVGLTASIVGAVGSSSAVDQIQVWASAGGNVGSSNLEEQVEILLRVNIAQRFKDTHGVGDVGSSGLRDLVDGFDALGGDDFVAASEAGGLGCRGLLVFTLVELFWLMMVEKAKLTAIGLELVRGGLVQGTESLLDGLSLVLGRLVCAFGPSHGRTGHNVIDDIRNLSGEAVLVGSKQVNASSTVHINVVASLEDFLEFANICLDGQPGLGLVERNALLRDARLDQPGLDGSNGVIIGGEKVNDLLVAQVLAVTG